MTRLKSKPEAEKEPQIKSIITLRNNNLSHFCLCVFIIALAGGLRIRWNLIFSSVHRKKLDPILLTQCHEMLSHFDDSHRKRACELKNNDMFGCVAEPSIHPRSAAKQKNPTEPRPLTYFSIHPMLFRCDRNSEVKNTFMFNRKRRNRVKILKEQEDNGVFFSASTMKNHSIV